MTMNLGAEASPRLRCLKMNHRSGVKPTKEAGDARANTPHPTSPSSGSLRGTFSLGLFLPLGSGRVSLTTYPRSLLRPLSHLVHPFSTTPPLTVFPPPSFLSSFPPPLHPTQHLSLGQPSCLFLSTSLLVFLLTSSRPSTSDSPPQHLFLPPPPQCFFTGLDNPFPLLHHNPPSISVLPLSPPPSLPLPLLPSLFPSLDLPPLLSSPPPRGQRVLFYLSRESLFVQ